MCLYHVKCSLSGSVNLLFKEIAKDFRCRFLNTVITNKRNNANDCIFVVLVALTTLQNVPCLVFYILHGYMYIPIQCYFHQNSCYKLLC